MTEVSPDIFIKGEWIKIHLNDIKNKAGARYIPKLHIELPIAEVFDGISRTPKFYQNIRSYYGELVREYREITVIYEIDNLKNISAEFKREINTILTLIGNIKEYNTEQIPWNEIKKVAENVEKLVSRLIDELWIYKKTLKDKNSSLPLREKIDSDIRYLLSINNKIQYFINLATSTKGKLSNHPFLLLTGEAGIGKTHLLCDIVEKRINFGLPAILLFGEYFNEGTDVWEQIIRQLNLPTNINTKEVFLGILSKAGECSRCRVLLVIDALNEAKSPNLWKKHLEEIIHEVKKYPNIALVISIRSGFEEEVLTEELIKQFVEVKHQGFAFKEWEAVVKFFNEFSLPLPEVPLLTPEFQNPLFLLLFCKALANEGRKKKGKEVLRGHEGFTYIFETYVDSVAENIEDEFGISHLKGENLWDTVIEKIAEVMVEHSTDRICEEKLIEIIENAHPNIEVDKLIKSLERNLLLVKVPRYSKKFIKNDGYDYRFPYQKFSDHLIVRYLLKKCRKESMELEDLLKKNTNIIKLLKRNYGLIEALSIQYPEWYKGKEFFEVASFIKDSPYIYEAFIESLIWRRPEVFSEITIRKISNFFKEKVLVSVLEKNKTNDDYFLYPHDIYKLLEAILSVTSVPKHPLNADFLHKHLMEYSMPERDAWWSTFLHFQHGDKGAVERIIEWSLSDYDKSNIKDEFILLLSTALAWFLTTSNRFIRDKSTKALVSLIQHRLHLLPVLLEKFKEVDDMYIKERLFAVAYACTLRNQDDLENIKRLANWVYENVFKNNKPPIHILLRDYARGIIEVALRKGVILEIDESKVNPPYESDWSENIPTEEELKKKYCPASYADGNTIENGFLDIWFSVMDWGDFARYIIGTNLGYFPWSRRKINSVEPNRKKLFEDFKKQLTDYQRNLLEKATNPFYGVKIEDFLNHLKYLEIKNRKIEGREKERTEAWQEFKNSLSEIQKDYFEKEIEPFLDESGRINDPLENFDLSFVQRWIFNRVVQLGYDPQIHGKFDRMINSRFNVGRDSHKPERIGKKYQWIAYHEFMALVSDHFEFKGDNLDDEPKSYKGPWNPHVRDIDPTLLVKNDEHLRESLSLKNWLLTYGKYDAWKEMEENIIWLKMENDLPDPTNIIEIVDDSVQNWLMLEGFIKWEEETPPEYKKYEIPIRELWYMIKSYIVRKKDLAKILEWTKKQNFWGRWMPESHAFNEIFLGEFPNSLAFEDLRGDYNIWTNEGNKGSLPVPVVVTDDVYLNEFIYDCSYEEAISIELPCKWLVDKLQIRHKYLDGRWFNENGEVVILPTAIFDRQYPISALLIRKEFLIEFIEKSEYAIFWTLIGEKNLIGGGLNHWDYKGHMVINGVYTIDRSQIVGNFTAKFEK
ncbi:AVAST type 2 anti-phage system protein Avs2 [Caldicellulosiruptor sp. DIB 104C]|uniref:AVAST type 2 anti-phage system protein Avs2 n=1 Tax=Caldicellulosiruptor sp. DIB 104C TaxID=3019889 RepID=UPI0023056E4D|nr:AVAST type 2 anti-phage system protein Avs2 [Caldicellulosiruptor sp. DIB 104C]